MARRRRRRRKGGGGRETGGGGAGWPTTSRRMENRKVTSKELRGDENYFSRGPLPSIYRAEFPARASTRERERTLKNPRLRNYFRFLLFIPTVESSPLANILIAPVQLYSRFVFPEEFSEDLTTTDWRTGGDRTKTFWKIIVIILFFFSRRYFKSLLLTFSFFPNDSKKFRNYSRPCFSTIEIVKSGRRCFDCVTRLIRSRFPKNLADKIANAIIRDLFPKNLHGWDKDKWIFTTLVYYLAYTLCTFRGYISFFSPPSPSSRAIPVLSYFRTYFR